mmetsp:Transcript_155342/g.496682  ORF Transcript_155342/g.496682 Transcript_155342/m.496682 type:complete len:231 (+) Transcript_155342:1-693(+)
MIWPLDIRVYPDIRAFPNVGHARADAVLAAWCRAARPSRRCPLGRAARGRLCELMAERHDAQDCFVGGFLSALLGSGPYTLVPSLRHLLQHVELSGDAQTIDRFFDSVASHMSSRMVEAMDRDTVYNLCFSAIMLDTDVHHSLRSPGRIPWEEVPPFRAGMPPRCGRAMTERECVAPNRGMGASDNVIRTLYVDVCSERIRRLQVPIVVKHCSWSGEDDSTRGSGRCVAS